MSVLGLIYSIELSIVGPKKEFEQTTFNSWISPFHLEMLCSLIDSPKDCYEMKENCLNIINLKI